MLTVFFFLISSVEIQKLEHFVGGKDAEGVDLSLGASSIFKIRMGNS